MKNLVNLILDGSKVCMKQTKACKMKLKQPQNGTRLNMKLTSKKKKTKEKHKKKKHLQK
jgi:hypothetical protein